MTALLVIFLTPMLLHLGYMVSEQTILDDEWEEKKQKRLDNYMNFKDVIKDDE